MLYEYVQYQQSGEYAYHKKNGLKMLSLVDSASIAVKLEQTGKSLVSAYRRLFMNVHCTSKS